MNTKKITDTEKIAPAIGAYSHAIVVPIGDSELIFVTGQIALDQHGNVFSPNNPEKQADFVFQNVGKILKKCHVSFKDVIKAQMFLTNIDDFSKISKIRNNYFAESKPATTMVEVSRLVKEGCCFELEVTAIKCCSRS